MQTIKRFYIIMVGSLRRYITLTTLILSLLLPAASALAQDETKKEMDQKTKERTLKREAANALYRLKYRLEKEGFYSGRVALNVWRSTAIDAGTFDQEQYDEFKKQLYEKSLRDSLKCFEEFIQEEDFYNADLCLQTWRVHSKEMGTYTQEDYEALKKKMADARKARASETKAADKK